MISRSLLTPILDDDHLTRGLDDAEARMLIEWLIERVERIDESSSARMTRKVRQLCRRARCIAQFVSLWCHERSACAALQFAATERLDWPMPTTTMVDACDLMNDILAWEDTPDDEKEVS
ncbi:MAG: hypothetical protein FJ303_24620 [Planctomycetes bacterium]|nr:hypothetical protein [Planctomycetota bacterium]